MSENKLEKYYLFTKVNDIIVINSEAMNLLNESFELFKELFNYEFGTIKDHGGLVEIHSGGWSDNEYLILELEKTGWWYKFFVGTISGGHYYFKTDLNIEKDWVVVIKQLRS